jgi:hypothetical protein
MNEFAFMYVYVYMSLCFMLLDSVLIHFICNCIYVCMSLLLCMSIIMILAFHITLITQLNYIRNRYKDELLMGRKYFGANATSFCRI